MKMQSLFALLLCCCSVMATAQGAITVHGSDSMLLLGMRWSQRLTKIFPAASLTVAGGGASGAAAAMGRGQVDITQSSRKLTKEERGLAGQMVEFPVGVESVVFYVNDENKVRELSIAQLRKLYLGEIDNWKALGGADIPVRLFTLEAFAGGSLFVRENLLNGRDVDDRAQGFTNPKKMAESLAAERGAIGFGPLMPVKGFHAVRVSKGDNFPAVEPTSANVRSVLYPLTRYFYWNVRLPQKPGVREVCNWVLSSEGQLIVESLGYYPLNSADRSMATGALATLK
jgi:phosphate transport system substrate-binding protein